MRRFVTLSLPFVVWVVFVSVCSALAGWTDAKRLGGSGEQLDERRRLAQQIQEAAQRLPWATMDAEDRRELRLQFDLTFERLRQTSLAWNRVGLEEIQRSQRMLTLKEDKAKQELAEARDSFVRGVLHLKMLKEDLHVAKKLEHLRRHTDLNEEEKRLESLEQRLKEYPQLEARLIQRANERALAARIMTDLVREFPAQSKKPPRPAK